MIVHTQKECQARALRSSSVIATIIKQFNVCRADFLKLYFLHTKYDECTIRINDSITRIPFLRLSPDDSKMQENKV